LKSWNQSILRRLVSWIRIRKWPRGRCMQGDSDRIRIICNTRARKSNFRLPKAHTTETFFVSSSNWLVIDLKIYYFSELPPVRTYSSVIHDYPYSTALCDMSRKIYHAQQTAFILTRIVVFLWKLLCYNQFRKRRQAKTLTDSIIDVLIRTHT